MSDWKDRSKDWIQKISEATESLRHHLRPMNDKFLSPAATRFRALLQRILPSDLAQALPKSWNWRDALEWAGLALQRRGAGFYGKLLTLLLCAFFLSDLAALWIEGKLPDSSEPGTHRGFSTRRFQPTEESYSAIWTRNLFNSRGLIPGEGATGEPSIDLTSAPQQTTLPLNLVGTIILKNELKSIATIEDKTASLVFPVRVEDEIPAKIKILKIEPNRVTFLNISSGRREFVEIPEDASTGKISLRSGGTVGSRSAVQIERAGNNFNVPRLELDRAFSDLNTVLTQARAVPHYENGVPAGYKLFQVVPEGLFGKLGLKDQDIICGIDGQSVNDPAKALELLGQLKTANHVELCVKRDGKQQNFAYDIR
ncbi:MAG: hypothetical protein RJB38_1215 [Pseudomonadota bacterium]|jgi:general secretion pathway protein C